MSILTNAILAVVLSVLVVILLSGGLSDSVDQYSHKKVTVVEVEDCFDSSNLSTRSHICTLTLKSSYGHNFPVSHTQIVGSIPEVGDTLYFHCWLGACSSERMYTTLDEKYSTLQEDNVND